MAAYLASNGRGEAPKKNEKKEPTTASKTTPNQKQAKTGHPLTDGSTDVEQRPSGKQNEKKTTKGEPREPKQNTQTATRPVEPPPAVVERAVQPNAVTPPNSSTAALGAPSPAPGARPLEQGGAPIVTLDIPMPELPTGPPADLTQPGAFSSSPLP